MRREIRWVLVALVALTLGVLGAVPYARWSAPYVLLAARAMAASNPWTIADVTVGQSDSSPATELRLDGYVYRRQGDDAPAARVVTRLSVGEAVETPVVFWGMLCAWPARSIRQRLLMLTVGLPIFLVLAGILTGGQLIHSMSDASAILAGDNDPKTLWDRASEFLEAGGLFVVDLSAALLVIAAIRSFTPRPKVLAER
jgi:hypothetical protein